MNKSKKEIMLENGTTVRVLSNAFPISTSKFRKIVDEKGLNFKQIGEKLGYMSNSISSAINAGYMTSIMIKGLDNVYGIKYEEYAYIPEKTVEQPAEPPEEKPAQQTMIPDSALYDTVKAAVMDAINEAIAGNMKNLRGCFYTAVYTAINAAKKEA